MKKFQWNVFVLIGVLGIFIGGSLFAVHLVRAFAGDRNIWWTNQNILLSLEESRDVFDLQHNGKSLQQLLSEGNLLIKEPEKTARVLTVSDWKVRVNNWHRVQASILAISLFPCALFCIGLTLFVVGIIQGLQSKTDKIPSMAEP